MNYLERKVKDATNEELLYELVQRNGWGKCPKHSAYYTPHVEALVAVGADATASIRIDASDADLIKQLVEKGDNR